MKKFLAFITLGVLPFFSFAQSNYQPGYVVTLKGDTVIGFIDYKERSVNPVKVVFKPERDSQTQVFSVNDCTAFGINQLETYQRFAVAISMSKESNTNLSHGIDNSERRDTVFLRVLQSGKHVVLYAYQDPLKKRFYISDQQYQTPEELKRNVYIRDGNRPVVVTDNQYVNQLQDIKRRNNTNKAIDERKWINLRYIESDLTKVAAEINEQEMVKAKFAATRFFVGTGLNVSKAKYSGKNALAYEGAKNKSSYLPFLTVGIDMFGNPAIKRIIYRAELSFLMGQYEMSNEINVGSSTNERIMKIKHVFNQYTAQLTPQVIFNLYNTNKLKFFASASLSINLSGYDNNKGTNIPVLNDFDEIIYVSERNHIELINFNYSARFNAGLVLNNRLELSAGYHVPSAVTQYSAYNIVVQRVTLGINFMLGKH